MSESVEAQPDRTMRQAVEIAVRLLVIAVVLTWSFQIVAPFINPIVWAAVIAVAVYPMFLKLAGWLGGRRKTAAALIVLLGIGIIIVPVVVMSSSLLGRGVDVPMLVVLLGAIGGMILSGIVGLFVGAVVLALGYRLTMVWLEMDADEAPAAGEANA